MDYFDRLVPEVAGMCDGQVECIRYPRKRVHPPLSCQLCDVASLGGRPHPGPTLEPGLNVDSAAET
jgi:hypothetical protein